MSAFEYPVRLTAGSDGRILVEFIDFPRLATDGKDKREALEEAMDALGSDLSIRLSRREEIPTPSAPSGAIAWCRYRFGWRRSWLCTWRCEINR
jgi:predicted RNase H-like HicB family nuclease